MDGAGTFLDAVALAAVAGPVCGTDEVNVEPPGRVQGGAWDEMVDCGCPFVVVVQGGVDVAVTEVASGAVGRQYQVFEGGDCTP